MKKTNLLKVFFSLILSIVVIFIVTSVNAADTGFTDMTNSLLNNTSGFNNTIGNYRLVNYLRYTTEINLLISKMDYMTGVYNRKGMTEMIGKLIDSSDKNDIVIIASVDIDGLKEINDSYGHENGDFAIKTIADAIQSISISNKYCGRFGGDEFVICAVVKNIGLKKIIETDVRRYIDNINKASDKPYKISASIGIESTLVKDFDFETILRIADRKMYNDKKHKGSFRGFRRLI